MAKRPDRPKQKTPRPDPLPRPKQPSPVITSMAPETPGKAADSIIKSRFLLSGVGVIAIVIILIPVWLYYRVVFQNAFNYPFEDDFNSALTFILAYTNPAASAVEKARLFFAQHNEHRIVFDRLVFVADKALTGRLNFRHLILVGNASLLFMFGGLLVGSFRSLAWPFRLLYLTPVAFVLFSFHFWELTVWGMASLQNLYVLVFALGSFYFLCQNPLSIRQLALACGLALAATFTSGNGIFTFIVGVPVLLLQKQYRSASVWLGIATLAALGYFWGFSRAGGLPDLSDSLGKNLSRSLDYFFTLTGSVFSENMAYPIRAGRVFLAVYLCLIVYLMLTRRLLAYLPMVALLTFLYITCGSLMLARSGFGVVQAFSPRYGILSVLLFGGLSTLIIETIGNRVLKGGAALTLLLVSVYLYTTSYRLDLLKINDRTRQLTMATAFYNDDPANLIVYWGTSQKEGKAIFDEAVKKKVYQAEPITFANLRSTPQAFDAARLIATNDVSADAKPYAIHDFIVFWNAWSVMNGIESTTARTEVVAQSAGGTYAFATSRHVRYDVVNQLQSMGYLGAGFSCVIHKKDLKPGRYTLWLHLTNGSADSYMPLNTTFDV